MDLCQLIRMFLKLTVNPPLNQKNKRDHKKSCNKIPHIRTQGSLLLQAGKKILFIQLLLIYFDINPQKHKKYHELKKKSTCLFLDFVFH